jgi:RimJ/RimL family protein N-acetyltransferase
VGLARVWIKPSGPRFGYVGVLPDWRRTSVTHLLLATVFGELHRLGHTSVAAEIDIANRASNAIAARAGAVRTGGLIELVRDVPPPSANPAAEAVA